MYILKKQDVNIVGIQDTCSPYLMRRKVNNAVNLLVGAALASSFRGGGVVQEGLPSRGR